MDRLPGADSSFAPLPECRENKQRDQAGDPETTSHKISHLKIKYFHLSPNIRSADRSETWPALFVHSSYGRRSSSATGLFPNRAAGVLSNARLVKAM